MGTVLHPRDGYPFSLDVRVECRYRRWLPEPVSAAGTVAVQAGCRQFSAFTPLILHINPANHYCDVIAH